MSKETIALASASDCVMVVNTLYSQDELRKLNTHGRELTKGEVNLILSSVTLSLENKDLGDNSFQTLTSNLTVLK